MHNNKLKPILITGSHRSGSTWVGKMIGLSPSVAYIQEPFNLIHRRDICRAEFEYWFTYICEQNESLYYKDINDCVRFNYDYREGLKSIKNFRDLARVTRDSVLFPLLKLFKVRPLLKDPIALFSADWLARNFDMQVVVLVRHPAAFAGSLKKPNWTHPFEHFVKQPLLMNNHLNHFRQEIEEYARIDKDIVDQAILLWNLIHSMILKYRENNPNWIFVRHEDISKSPIEEFSKLYDKLNLDYSNNIRKKIANFSRSKTGAQDKNIKIARDSKSNISSWKNRLTKSEVQRIKYGTKDIASQFYEEEEWAV